MGEYVALNAKDFAAEGRALLLSVVSAGHRRAEGEQLVLFELLARYFDLLDYFNVCMILFASIVGCCAYPYLVGGVVQVYWAIPVAVLEWLCSVERGGEMSVRPVPIGRSRLHDVVRVQRDLIPHQILLSIVALDLFTSILLDYLHAIINSHFGVRLDGLGWPSRGSVHLSKGLQG